MTIPTIEGPVTGGNGPFLGGGTAGLAEHDYTQTEYFIAGRADAYELGSDGVVNVADTADYRTRILVHRPADAARFNGTVVVEWLNVSGGVDGRPDWTFLHREMMRSGYAWVGVSAESVGVHGGPAIMETAGPDEPHHGRPRALRLALAPGRHLLVRHVRAGRCGRPWRRGDRARRAGGGSRHRHRRVAVGVPAHDVRQRRRSAHPGLRRLLRARARPVGLTPRRERARARPVGTARALPRRPPAYRCSASKPRPT